MVYKSRKQAQLMEKYESFPLRNKIQKCQMPPKCFRNIAGKHERNIKTIEINTETAINKQRKGRHENITLCMQNFYTSRKLSQKKNITDNKSDK